MALIIGILAVAALVLLLKWLAGPEDEPGEAWPEEDWWESRDWQFPDRRWEGSGR